ncbi:hypothetical protein C8E87_5032 [Paractinoplanes brasiliensis]|uniref:Uncharacterized protein n=1 Tax=Paractinoplanes brasiliensis TaxID=52695 RepID=A0A4R6JZG1_9ACTN|nr:hypothetical protein C8E87_5032 [Actinoplanes brasiliensis]
MSPPQRVALTGSPVGVGSGPMGVPQRVALTGPPIVAGSGPMGLLRWIALTRSPIVGGPETGRGSTNLPESAGGMGERVR